MRIRLLIAALSLLAATLVVALYWPGLHGRFFFDDAPNILLPEGVRLESFTFESIRQALVSGFSGPSGRPVAQFSFAVNYFFSGFDPFAFKATNLVIHLVCTALVFGLSSRLFSSVMPEAQRRDALVVAGVLATGWLLHPLQLTSVLYVVQRMTSLSALFLLAAVWLHIGARQRIGCPALGKLIGAWIVLWPLSVFSKESGALFPLFVLAWELIVRRRTTGGLDRFARYFAATTSVVLLSCAVYSLSLAGQWLWAGYSLRTFSLVERLLTEGRVLWFYLSLIIFPRLESLGLYHDDIALSTGLITPWTTLPSIAGLIGLVWLAWRLRRQAPLVSFGIAWFFVGHALESTALPLEIAHEHRNYLPLYGILLAGACGLARSIENQGALKTMGIALAGAMLANFTFVTALRAHQFGDEGRRTQIEAQHHRASARAQYEAGRIVAEQPDALLADSPVHAFASSHYQLACELDPSFKACWLGLIDLDCRAGRPVEQASITGLTHRLRDTPFAPGDRNILYSVKEMSIAGRLCLGRPEVDGLFAAALTNPTTAPSVQAILHSWHADYLWLHEHDMAAARAALGQSLALNSANLSNRLKWAQLVYISGQKEQAKQLLLELRDKDFSADERKTLNELLATYNMPEY